MLFLFTAGALQATLLVNENFSYATGQLTDTLPGNVSGGLWRHNTGTGYLLQCATGSLSYPGYESSSTGNMLAVTNPAGSAEDGYREFAYLRKGSAVYAACLVNISDTVGLAPNSNTTGDYFAGLLPVTSTTTYVNRIYIRKGAAANTFNLGLRAASTSATLWHASNLAVGTTCLLVMRYKMVSGSNDTAMLFINPTVPGTEPAPSLTQAAPSTAGPDSVGRFAVRQNYAAPVATPNALIDGIRAADTWSDATGAGFFLPLVVSVTPGLNASGVPPTADISVTFDKLINAATVDTASFKVSGLRQARYYPDSIRPAGNSATFTFFVHDTLRRKDTVTVTLSTAIADTGGNHLPSDFVWSFRTATPDTIPPKVSATSPAAGSNNVAVATQVVVDFNKPLSPASIDTGAIRLEGRRGGYQLYGEALSNGDTRVTVVPTDTLFYADTVRIHVTSRVTNVDGTPARDTSVTFTTRVNPALTIHDIQYTTNPSGASPYVNRVVTFTGVITAGSAQCGGKSYFIQDGKGAWNGIYAYDNGHTAIIGDSVRITAKVLEYQGTGWPSSMTELQPVTEYTVLKQNCTPPAPVILPACSLATGAASCESYESVLVEVDNSTVTSAPSSYNEWNISDPTGSCMIYNPYGFTGVGYNPAVGDTLLVLRGVLVFQYTDFKVQPRMIGDIVDTKPVKVGSTKPAAYDSLVSTMTPLIVNFSKPMNPATVTAGNFSVTGSITGAHTFTVAYDSSTWSCRLRPDRVFSYAETVTVWLSHTLRDTLGKTLDGNGDGVSANNLSDDYRFKFYTLDKAITIAMAQKPDTGGYNSAMAGKNVRIQGILTGPAKIFSSSTWTTTASDYIQDSTSGANIFSSGINWQSNLLNNLGQLIVVKGTVTEYNGVTEITTNDTLTKFWDFAQSLPAPDTMVYNQVMTEDMEGKLMMAVGTVSSPPSYAGGGYNMEIRNGDAPIAVRFSETSGFPIDRLTMGQKVQVIGVASQYDKYAPYDAGYQLTPRFNGAYSYNGVTYPSDITILVDTVAALGTAQIVGCSPRQFCPDWGEVATVEVNGPLGDHLTLTVYDLKGRLVKTLLNNVPGGHQVCVWDGKDDAHRPANIGIYILHLRSVSAKGNVADQNKTIVLGTPLK
ncbi:MAG TPA: Ig-like domain-containing protein [Candidatus Edwardsbacteria bacterium]|nr:Ig-like domain-containing protein [Candidatus Edwardsbacteria bacterium]